MIQETDLREMLATRAEDVEPPADAYPRLLARRRRVRRRNAVIGGVLAVALGGSIGTWAMAAEHGFPRGMGPAAVIPADARPLVDAPTRGNLAKDNDYVTAFKQAALKTKSGRWAWGGGRSRKPEQVRVLFVGDVPGGRLGVLFDTVTQVSILFTAPGHASARVLGGSPDGSETAAYGDKLLAEPVASHGVHASVIMGPSGSDVFLSPSARYGSDGVIRRSWQRVAKGTGYHVFDSNQLLRGAARVRITASNRTFYEGQILTDQDPPVWEPDAQTVQQAMTGMAGGLDSVTARKGLAFLSGETGLTSKYATFRVLWGAAGGLAGKGGPTLAVTAITADGGGPYMVLGADSKGNWGTLSQGVIGDPSRSLIAWWAGAGPALFAVGPPTVVSVEFVPQGGGAPIYASIAHGLAELSVPHSTPGTLRAYDAQGAVIATRSWSGNDKGVKGLAPIEPEIKPWRK